MKCAKCGVALFGALMLSSCAGAEQFLASGSGMFLKLGPATLGLGNTQQGWIPLNSMNWAGGQYPQQGYPVNPYPQQAYPQQTYPQQAYDPTGQTYGGQQTYPQQAYDPTGQAYGGQQAYPQQAYDPTGQTYGGQQAYPQQTYPQQTYPQQAYDPTGQTYGGQQTYPQQAYPQQTYPQQAYAATGQTNTVQQANPQQPNPQQANPQQPTNATAQASAPQQPNPQQTNPQQTGPQQANNAAGQAGAAPGTAETYPQVASAPPPAPAGPGLATFSTDDPAAAEALAQACASGQPTGPVTVRQLQPDGSYQDIELTGVNLACGSPAAGGQTDDTLSPGEEVMMTFSNAKVVNKGKIKRR